MIPESFKQDLLNRVDIVDVINSRVPLKKGGANWMA
ncbi:MAG TPA: CHC2 zinc finger domain-containing protein, partial [Burkholderiales bacterium]